MSSDSRLKQAIVSLVKCSFGNRVGSYLPCSAYRLRLLLYLTELEWFRDRETTYLGYPYIYAANGPWFQEFDRSLYSLVGLELAESTREFEAAIEYEPGHHFRKFDQLDSSFEQLLSEIKQRYHFTSVASIKNLVYGMSPMIGANLGDVLLK